MGYKNICIDCRKSFNLGIDTSKLREGNCPDCGCKMNLVSHLFQPPKKADLKRWKVVEYLIQKGFNYGHVTNERHEYVPYPESMKEAIDFVQKYK